MEVWGGEGGAPGGDTVLQFHGASDLTHVSHLTVLSCVLCRGWERTRDRFAWVLLAVLTVSGT